MSWELVGWGIPTSGDAVSRQADSNYWYNMEDGDRAPTDADISRSTEAVVKITDDESGDSAYWTVHLDFMDDLQDFDEYVSDVFVDQYP